MGADIRVDYALRDRPRRTAALRHDGRGYRSAGRGRCARDRRIVRAGHDGRRAGYHIDRGYDRIESMLAKLGARIERYSDSPAKRSTG